MDKRIPYHRKPEELTVDEWQAGLRKQFASEQKFRFKNIGLHPVFSDFEVFNPETAKTYKVSIRDNISSYNYCSCPDFTINALGTCKHIEYMLNYFARFKKYRKLIEKPYKPTYSSLSVFYGAERKIRFKKGVNAVSLENEQEYFDKTGFLKTGMIGSLPEFIKSVTLNDSEFRVYPDVYELIEQQKKEEEWNSIARNLFKLGDKSHVYNKLVRAELYPYQRAGVRKIIETRRILLADDMGLGKTLQAIAAAEILADYFGVRKVLIICPTSLKYQWKREIEKFCTRSVVIVEGLVHKRKDQYDTESFYKIISYGVCHNDLQYIHNLGSELVIIDEAQRIKNWKTQTAQSVKKIKSDFTFVLTGTPLENRIEELHSIVEYIDRYKLGPLFRFLDKHQVLDDNGKVKGYKNLRDINNTLADVMLRRTKKEIIDQLPGRSDKNFFVEMTREQMAEHEGYYDNVRRLVTKWLKTGFLSEDDRQRLLVFLNCMRMVCDSTYLLNQKSDYGSKVSELSDLLENLLEVPTNKIVIFSQWKRMFDLIIKKLQELDIDYVYLNGDLPAARRKDIIDRFQDDMNLKIFLSTDAGGVGVNLQSGNVLINMDLPWNPAVLEQRIGRIFRLGQKKHVNVFNFISKKSIEHRILYLLDFKKSVFTGVLEEEGQNEVMLEGFLESVKNLVDIDIENPYDVKDSGNNSANMALERYEISSIQEEETTYVQNIITVNVADKTKESIKATGADSVVSFLSRIRIGIKKFLNQLLKAK